jgi:riboflavin kinase/FMN adenylyltransferase
MGPNWSFGKDRQGNATVLEKIGRDKGFAVHEIEPFCIEGEIASSTRIRETIGERNFALAAVLLGRSYAIEGKVVHGDSRGRSIGFPTANLSEVFQMLPPPGVYACVARLDKSGKPSDFAAVLNIGNRPTFGADGDVSIEAHLLDFSGDVYGENIELSNFVFIRGEKKFPGVEALKDQIAQDIVTARGLLRKE